MYPKDGSGARRAASSSVCRHGVEPPTMIGDRHALAASIYNVSRVVREGPGCNEPQVA
jgi:hypothetical protein